MTPSRPRKRFTPCDFCSQGFRKVVVTLDSRYCWSGPPYRGATVLVNTSQSHHAPRAIPARPCPPRPNAPEPPTFFQRLAPAGQATSPARTPRRPHTEYNKLGDRQCDRSRTKGQSLRHDPPCALRSRRTSIRHVRPSDQPTRSTKLVCAVVFMMQSFSVHRRDRYGGAPAFYPSPCNLFKLAHSA